MAARLLFLGRLQDAAGRADLDVSPGPLEAVLAALPPALALALRDERVRIAHNGQLCPAGTGPVLADGDELAFLPPVSGG